MRPLRESVGFWGRRVLLVLLGPADLDPSRDPVVELKRRYGRET